MRMTREHAALLLGVDHDASPEQINHAWRVWAKLAHPDTGGDREHFEALALARSVLMSSVLMNGARVQVSDGLSPGADEVSPVDPRHPLRRVCCRPSLRGCIAIGFALAASVLVLLLASQLSDLGAALAVGAAAGGTAIVIQRCVLGTGADTGHRIHVLVVAWLPLATLLAAGASFAGVELIGYLPVIALPFVLAVALVNPGAGLWHPIRLPSR